MNTHRKYDVLDAVRGFRLMPRKMSGNEINKMDWLIVTINTPKVVFDRAIHLYGVPRSAMSGGPPGTTPAVVTISPLSAVPDSVYCP
jgi:hypothetical protein